MSIKRYGVEGGKGTGGQHLPFARAVEAAVYLHGLAADLAVRQGDEHTLLATDSLQQFSRAFRFDSRGENGYVWLQGQPPESLHTAVPHEARE